MSKVLVIKGANFTNVALCKISFGWTTLVLPTTGTWISQDGTPTHSHPQYSCTDYLLTSQYQNCSVHTYCGNVVAQVAYFDSEKNFISYQLGNIENTSEYNGYDADWRTVKLQIPSNAYYFIVSHDTAMSLYEPSYKIDD